MSARTYRMSGTSDVWLVDGECVEVEWTRDCDDYTARRINGKWYGHEEEWFVREIERELYTLRPAEHDDGEGLTSIDEMIWADVVGCASGSLGEMMLDFDIDETRAHAKNARRWAGMTGSARREAMAFGGVEHE